MSDIEHINPVGELEESTPCPQSLAMEGRAGVRGQAPRFAEALRQSRASPPHPTLFPEHARGRELENPSSSRIAA